MPHFNIGDRVQETSARKPYTKKLYISARDYDQEDQSWKYIISENEVEKNPDTKNGKWVWQHSLKKHDSWT